LIFAFSFSLSVCLYRLFFRLPPRPARFPPSRLPGETARKYENFVNPHRRNTPEKDYFSALYPLQRSRSQNIVRFAKKSRRIVFPLAEAIETRWQM